MFKRIAGRLVQAVTRTAVEVDPPPKLVWKDGSRLAVLRALTEEGARAALEEAKAIAAGEAAGTLGVEEGAERFQKILDRKSVFVGLLAQTSKGSARLVDPETMADVGEVLPGDSFADYEALLAAGPQIVAKTP